MATKMEQIEEIEFQHKKRLLWRMAGLRVMERQRRKPKFQKLVEEEYERLMDEAEQADEDLESGSGSSSGSESASGSASA